MASLSYLSPLLQDPSPMKSCFEVFWGFFVLTNHTKDKHTLIRIFSGDSLERHYMDNCVSFDIILGGDFCLKINKGINKSINTYINKLIR